MTYIDTKLFLESRNQYDIPKKAIRYFLLLYTM